MTTRVTLRRVLTTAAMAALSLMGACSARDTDRDGARDTTSVAGAVAAGPREMAMPDAQMQAVLDQLQALGPKPLETLTPAEARKQPTPADAAKAQLQKEGKPTTPDPAVASMDRTIPGPGGALPVRIYTPKEGTAPFPVVVYYHGGGWVIADKNVYDAGARALSKMVGAVVVSVDYRQGPEHKFPAAHDDAYATYEWALKNAASIRGDPTRIALAGESAGGGLAVATAMMARDRGVQAPLAVVSVYPIAGTDTTTASYVENANAKPLSRAGMGWFFRHYLRSPQDAQDPRLNLVAADLKGLPPTTIINAQIDPLRSEGEMLADRLRAAGVDVEQKTYDGVAHEFFGMGMVVDKAMDAQKMAAGALTKRMRQ